MKELESGELGKSLNKFYIRIMMDDEDDSFCTDRYAKMMKHSGTITFADLHQETIFVPLLNKKLKTKFGQNDDANVLEEITFFVLVCLNTEEEKSYLDEIIFESELKLNYNY